MYAIELLIGLFFFFISYSHKNYHIDGPANASNTAVKTRTTETEVLLFKSYGGLVTSHLSPSQM
jgi:hypothetical protein